MRRYRHPLSRLDDMPEILARLMHQQPENAADWFVRCEKCGELIDLRNVRQVAHHEHTDTGHVTLH